MLRKNRSGTKPGKRHFRDEPLLKTLGAHCRRLRIQRGYSIDRLAKESERLSTSVIHRLECGSGAVTVSALFRYASVLGISPKLIFDFSAEEEAFEGRSGALAGLSMSDTTGKEKPFIFLENDSARVKKERFRSLLPVYSLKAAAGGFGRGEAVEPEGWAEVKRHGKLDSSMFVARAVGDSMLPKIRSGDYLVFRANPEGSRQGKIVLVQYRGPADPESGGSYTVKLYRSSKVLGKDGHWTHKQVVLSPLNPEFEPIVLSPSDEDDFQIIAEYLFTL